MTLSPERSLSLSKTGLHVNQLVWEARKALPNWPTSCRLLAEGPYVRSLYLSVIFLVADGVSKSTPVSVPSSPVLDPSPLVCQNHQESDNQVIANDMTYHVKCIVNIILSGMIWYGTAQYNTIWYGMIWYNKIWYSLIWYDTIIFAIGD